MRKEISISLLALGLAACGGGSSSSDSGGSGSGGNNTLVINKDFASGIRGTEQEPALTSESVSEADSVTLNTNLTGTVLEDSSVRFNFTPTESKKVAFVLSSGAADLDLEVTSQRLYLEADGFDSNEALVTDVIADQLYTVEVHSYEGQGSFQLKIVEANRSSLGLSTNEYLIESQHTAEVVCVQDGEASTYNYTDAYNSVINWKDGYIIRLSEGGKSSFTSVDDNSFTVIDAKSETAGDESYASEFTMSYTTNFETGALNGSLISKTTYVDNTGTEVCNSNIEITAEVIL